MTDPIILTLPWPMSVNRMYEPVYRYLGRKIVGAQIKISAQGQAYKDEACLRAKVQTPVRNLEGRLYVGISVFPPDRIRRDLDNLLKVLLDSVTAAGIWKDDSQVKALFLEMRDEDPQKPGCIKILIRPWER